jgi:hypothetical protein
MYRRTGMHMCIKPCNTLVIKLVFQTKRTLRMRHDDHVKVGKELQRKIAKLREENKDPSLPQKPPPPPRSSLPFSNTNTHLNYGPRHAPSPPPSGGRLTDSHNMGEESFMVLGQRASSTPIQYTRT